MVELTDLDGVGPARSESLSEAGYDTVAAVAAADPEQLAEDADLPEDTALEFVVQAQNLTEDSADDVEDAEGDSEGTEESDGPMPSELAAEEQEEPDAADTPAEESDDEAGPFSFEVSLNSDLHYDAYLSALLRGYERRKGSHEPSELALERALNQVRYAEGGVKHSLNEFAINTVHAAVKQQVTDYKGDNMIEHFDALNDVLDALNEARDEYLF